jgi:hypothetical protein
MMQSLKELLKWLTQDRSAAAVWLRENCTEVERYTFDLDKRGRETHKAWTVKPEVHGCADDIEVTIAIVGDQVRAYVSDGIVTLAEVRIRCQVKWRDAMCEAIFWVMGFIAGVQKGHLTEEAT